ncbi:MAG: TolC family protein [Opitutales bacterium]|nr:TolC family protein [Opitutales bacterium]
MVLFLLTGFSIASTAGDFRVAVVQDGPLAKESVLVEKLRAEIEAASLTVELVDGGHADWDLEVARGRLEALLEDEAVDAILADGVLVTMAAADGDFPLSKPVISGFAHRAEVFDLPVRADGTSRKANFNWVVMPGGLLRDFEVLQEMTDFERLYAVVDGHYKRAFPEAAAKARELAAGQGLELILLSAEDQAGPLLEKIPGEAVVYLTPLPRFTEEENKALREGLADRRVISFSALGHSEVEKGILASLNPDAEGRLARRLSLHLEEVKRGAQVEEMTVFLRIEERLLINTSTARRIDWAPPLGLLLQADFTEERLALGEPLSWEEAMKRAEREAPEAGRDEARETEARWRVAEARSRFLPQVEGFVEYEQVDRTRAQRSLGILPRRTATSGAEVRMVLFSDAVRTAFLNAREGVAIARAQTEVNRLDRLEETGQRYLEALAARALWQVELDNLQVTRRNLELARTRDRVGVSGPEEILRWDAREVQQRAATFQARADFYKAKAALNEFLGRDTDKLWELQEIPERGEGYYFFDTEMEEVLSTTRSVRLFRRFAALTTLRESPELAALEGERRVLDRREGERRRAGVVPEISAGGRWEYEFYDDRPLDVGLSPDEQWGLQVTASLPLFEGGRRVSEVQRLRAGGRALEREMERIRRKLALRTEAAARSLEGSWPSVSFARQAAEKAEETLEIVQERYARGVVSVIDLLEAQNQALETRRRAELAWYQYLGDSLALQRSMGWFAFLEEEKNEQWLGALKQYIEKHNP